MTGEQSTDGADQCPTMEIPRDNPFRDRIIDMCSDGYSWQEIWEKLEEAYNPVDKAADKEALEEIPKWSVTANVYDPDTPSQRRFEEYERIARTQEEAEEMVEGVAEVLGIESDRTEQVGTEDVYT